MERQAPTLAATAAGAPRRQKVLMATVVWGDWYLKQYLELNLPSLLAPGNLPRLAAQHDLAYLVMTRTSDLDRIRRSPVMQRVAALLPVEFRAIPESELANAFGAHRANWDRATDQARRNGQMILYLPPDVMWSDGSFAHIGDLLAGGYRAIAMQFLRVVDPTFLDDMAARLDHRRETIAFTGRELVAISLRHIHPLMGAHLYDSPYFSSHPEMVIWPVRGQGLLVRCLAREVFLYDPSRTTLNSAMLVDTSAESAGLHLIDDSDRLFAISLAPLGKDSSWYLSSGPADLMTVARWWLAYDSPTNDFVAGTIIRWHEGDIDESRWQRAERASRLWVRRAAATREGLRIWRALMENGSERTSELLALASGTGLLARALNLPTATSAFIFAPSDRAMAQWSAADRDRIFHASCLTEFLQHHVVLNSIGTAKPLEDTMRPGDTVRLSSAAGSVVEIARHEGGLLLEGKHMVGRGIQVGPHVVYEVDQILGPDR